MKTWDWELHPNGWWAWESSEYLCRVTPLLSARQMAETRDVITGERRRRHQEYGCSVWRGGTLIYDVISEDEEMARHACQICVQALHLADVVADISEWTHIFGAALCPPGADTYGEGVRDTKAQVAALIHSADLSLRRLTAVEA